jgi:hypothetical protein
MPLVMAVAGNAISCDECGRQMSMPMQGEAAGPPSLEKRVRAYAIERGWTCAYGVDFCPQADGTD